MGQEWLALRALENGFRHAGRDRIELFVGDRRLQQAFCSGGGQMAYTQFAQINEIVVPYFAQIIKRGGARHQQAQAAAVLNGGAQQTHKLLQLAAMVGKQGFDAFKFIDAD